MTQKLTILIAYYLPKLFDVKNVLNGSLFAPHRHKQVFKFL